MPTKALHFRWFALPLAAVAAVAGLGGCSSSADEASASPTPGDPVASDGSLTLVEDGLDAGSTASLNAAATESFAGVSAPGAVMAIRTPEGTWAATIGFLDWDETTPITADVHQRVGSVTKTFTVTALLQLAERGDLSLDDPIDRYVPGMPNGDATLYDLAAMRSGIPSYTFDEEFQQTVFADPNHAWAPQELVDLVKGDAPMFAPGTRTFYSNTNTVLLGMVIEQVAGRPIQDVMQEQIIGPLGLSGTVFPTDASFPEPHANGYTTQGTDDGLPVDATDWNPSWGWTAGAMISDLDDLLVWGEALVTGEGLLSPEWQQTRLDSFDFSIPVYVGEGQDAPQSEARAYGLGLGLALGWYGHTGELPGYNTVVQHHPETGTTLIVMVNSDIKSGECPADARPRPAGAPPVRAKTRPCTSRTRSPRRSGRRSWRGERANAPRIVHESTEFENHLELARRAASGRAPRGSEAGPRCPRGRSGRLCRMIYAVSVWPGSDSEWGDGHGGARGREH
ncbi:serine hydrolase domain-containing protein [Agromyces larvae]|uniref:Beta-lactamase family protein n=1 Tax=Agromyces larvae TaxID=2929802 RepID=A0ABY4BY34_9MICO|nr:serine hydrolase domain-containing protein [Agromyces larvae]UOE44150.1 beta-lactamase family protein [Agromyces larvae]